MKQNHELVDDINNRLSQIESNLNLFDQEIGGVFYWERVRHPIHKELQKKTLANDKVTTQESPSQKESYIDLTPSELVSKIISGIKSVYLNNPYFENESDIIFYSNTRRRKLNNKLLFDMYLDPIAEELDCNYIFIEPYGIDANEVYPDAVANNQTQLLLPLNISNLITAAGYEINIGSKQKHIIRKFEKKIKEHFNVEINALTKIKNDLSERKVKIPLYEKIISRIDPKLCIMTEAHSKHSTFIEACKNNGVKVIEFQSYALHHNKWTHHYPKDRQRKIQADYIFLWGEFWKSTVSLPFRSKDIFVTGFPYYEQQQQKYKYLDKLDRIIFISNPNTGHLLSKLAAELSKKNIKYDIIYKLHGVEFDSWEKDYSELAKASESQSIEVIDEIEGSLHQLLAQSKIQVGVSSTALYEGIGFGLPTLIVNSPYSSEMKEVINRGYASTVKSADDLLTKINNMDSFVQPTPDYIFNKYSTKRTINAIDSVKNEL